ncbi:MAG: hypothetical protein ACOH2E_00450 [Candidatus Paracaedibacter sp.]
MRKFYFNLCLIVISFYSTITQACMVSEIKTMEEAKRIAPLYHDYKQKHDLQDEEFINRWEKTHNQPGYYMLAAYPKAPSSTPVGFIDFAIFPSLFDSPSMMRIDSVYIDEKVQAEEETVFRQLFDKVVDIGKEHEVKRIICDSGDKFPQEIRLFSLTMERHSKNALFKQYIS